MMLSPRRFWCVVCLGALVVGGFFFEPIQQYAQQFAIQYAFGGNLSAANFRLHRQQELLEVNEIRASQADDAGQVDMTVERALIKVDMPTLLDKRLVSSRVKLQGVQIELASLPVQKPAIQSSIANVVPWQDSLQKVISAFQWEHLRSDCEALLKSDSVLNELESRMRGWLLRSQQIMFHGDQLTKTIQSYSNPLRHQNEIRSQLSQIEKLRAEQDNLQMQFSGVHATLASHLKEIQALGEQELATMHSLCEAKAAPLRNSTAEQIVCEWANQLVQQQLQFTQSFATLLQAETRTNPYDVNVRNPNARTPQLTMSEISADGILCCTTQRLPFTAKGEYTAIQRVDYHLGRTTDWAIEFEADQVATKLQIASGELASVWNLKSTSTESTQAATNATMLELEASLSGRNLSGKARMNLGMYRAFSKLPCKGNADLADTKSPGPSTTSLDDQWVEFSLSGLASDPQVVLTSSLPTEFTDTVTNSIQKRIETQLIDSESKLKIAINAKIDELSSQLSMTANNGQQTVAKQRDVLAAMHRELEQNLQSREGFEYARLPTLPNTNR